MIMIDRCIKTKFKLKLGFTRLLTALQYLQEEARQSINIFTIITKLINEPLPKSFFYLFFYRKRRK